MFNDAIWEHIDRFTKAKKTSDIQQQLERFSHQMGFDYFRLLIIFPISMQKSHVALFNNCPTSWFDAYTERHYLTQDPVVFLGLKQTQPIFWNKLDCDSPWLPSASREVMNLAADFGVRNGVSFPLHTPQGEHGILSFISKEKSNSDLMFENVPMLSFCASYIFNVLVLGQRGQDLLGDSHHTRHQRAHRELPPQSGHQQDGFEEPQPGDRQEHLQRHHSAFAERRDHHQPAALLSRSAATKRAATAALVCK